MAGFHCLNQGSINRDELVTDTFIQTTEKLALPNLDNPRHTRYFADDVGDHKAGRDHDNRQHTELEK